MTDAITPISPTVRGFMGRSCRSPAASTVCKNIMFVESRKLNSRLNNQAYACWTTAWLVTCCNKLNSAACAPCIVATCSSCKFGVTTSDSTCPTQHCGHLEKCVNQYNHAGVDLCLCLGPFDFPRLLASISRGYLAQLRQLIALADNSADRAQSPAPQRSLLSPACNSAYCECRCCEAVS